MGLYGIEPRYRSPAGVRFVEVWGGPDRQEVIPVHEGIQDLTDT